MHATRSPWTSGGADVEHRLDPVRAALARCGARPGITLTGPAGRRDELLGLDLRTAGEPVERWVRGPDAVAVYEPDDPRRLRSTAMWRIADAAPPTIAAWELVVSAQTSLLESDASVTVVSTVSGDTLRAADWPATGDGLVWRRAADRRRRTPATACLLLRRPDEATSLLIATYPGDPGGLVATFAAGGRVRIECPLFASRVEKGVLLRGRVLAAIGPRDGDEAWAAGVATAFAASPPVLET